MVIVEPGPGPLDCRVLSTFCARDPLVGHLPVVIFHGPSTTTNSTQNSSRIQAHIFSIAGYQSFPRLTISPTSTLYSAVHHLPQEDQGDEICRGLAICLFKYFSEIPKLVKQFLADQQVPGRAKAQTITLFDGRHAASLASRMNLVEDASAIANHLLSGLSQRCLSWIDVDIVLPRNSIRQQQSPTRQMELENRPMYLENGKPPVDYGKFSEFIGLLGVTSFLPTSKLRRAPSKPTALSRSQTLTDDQVLSLQREMNEVVETEKSYVQKILDLTKSDTMEYSRNELRDSSRSALPSAKAMRQLFPASLTQILKINTEFLESMQDLVGDHRDGSTSQKQSDSTPFVTERDPTGAEAFAKVLLKFFPRFKDPYQDYLQNSSQCQSTLNNLLRDPSSSFARAVYQTGEQRLRSWLIEPVQRLPRYSLYIENIANKLPTDHPAIPKLLRAKDIAADICALEQDQADDNVRTIRTLRALITNWPDRLLPKGRLITAVDVVDLKAPYIAKSQMHEDRQSLLLLFSDYILIIRKLAGNKLSARGLLAEVDRPQLALITSSATSQGVSQQLLSLDYSFQLQETHCTESADGRLIHVACISQAPRGKYDNGSSTKCLASIRVFGLLGSYEGKAAKWSEEVARARVESRFPERIRDDDRWSLRVTGPQTEKLGVISAILEDGLHTASAINSELNSRVRIALEHADQPDSTLIWDKQNTANEIAGRVIVQKSNKYYLEFRVFGETSTVDNVEADEFLSAFTKRLGNLLRLSQQPRTPQMVQAFIATNQRMAESLSRVLPLEQAQLWSKLKPVSPVKALSSFIGGIARENFSYTNLHGAKAEATPSRSREPVPSRQPKFLAQSPAPRTDFKINIGESKPKAGLGDNIFTQLENTLSTYVVALHTRSGNIVGKVVRNRANADVRAVNELYNALLEDPNQYQTTAEVTIDVLFSAFEKFLHKEWSNRIGPVLPQILRDRMHTLFDTVAPGRLQDPFKDLLNEMSPQNRRAFSALIKLLYELLEASGNDGDRGALTAAFAEIMVQEANPHSCIPLLDRLVENIDVLFDDVGPIDGTSASKSSSLQGTKTTNTGSLSSTASSLKKRFGFGNLTRENSKTDSESRVGQILRNLSKKASTEANSQPSSLSRSLLARSRSTDNENRRPMLSRPVSKDNNQGLSGSSQNTAPATTELKSPPPPINKNGTARVVTAETPRRKRRSSLSDLPSLKNSPIPDFASPNQARKIDVPPDSVSPFQNARRVLRTPSPSKMQRFPGDTPSKIPSPANLKENMPPASINQTVATPSKQVADKSLGSGFSPKKRDTGATQIPSAKHGILGPPSLTSSPSKSSSPQKLRIQSPQKLRERLDREKRAIEEAGPSLRTELSKIKEEISGAEQRRESPTRQSKDVSLRLNGLETKTNGFFDDVSRRVSAIQADIDSSLAVSEKKGKSLDELYREANAENEMLYERFNTELGRVLKSVKDVGGAQELKVKLKESQDEAARLRKENQRLKRENLGLRSQLKGP